ncbi:tetratricopeptide repeat protein [Lyngbya aestuarii]|uniref:tetratricopeptide repeat protein n=1 Tax=Lyngbya aestuarii TaxID=118322 RepID=UPI00403DB3B7
MSLLKFLLKNPRWTQISLDDFPTQPSLVALISSFPSRQSLKKASFLVRPQLWQLATIAFYSAMLLLCFSSVTLAKSAENEQENVNPLELTTPDPLLPNPPEEQPLSPLQRQQLGEALNQLNQQAAAQLAAGNTVEAFSLWYREIRLRRQLGGSLAEVQSLGRVGAIAWQANHKPQIQLITARLEKIQQEAQTEGTLDQPLLMALGKAYEQLRVPGQALTVYEQILADARQRNDAEAIEATLQTVARLHMAWFDYPKAAAAYEELLTIAQTKGDRVQEFNYLKQLAYIYDQAEEPENALRLKQKLAASYPANDPQLPALKIAIGSDYEALDKLDEASKNYQEAYTLAFALQQFAYAGDALQKLAALYRSHEQPEFALQIYQVLLQVEQFSYDYYGLMDAYDQIGQINLGLKNYGKALEAFEKGLDLAKSLKYQETYFISKIEQVKQQSVQ